MQIHTTSEIVNVVVICFILAICVEAVIELWLTAAPLEPVRAFLARLLTESRMFGWILALTTCGYCMSVWAAASVAFIPYSIVDNAIIGWFINFLLIHRFANMFHSRIMKKSISLEPYLENK